VFAVFCIHGAWPVPDVNEPYYLGKAIHYWNPDWIPNDSFLNSSDTHQVFYFAFGWLSIFLPPFALAWVGRLITWGLLACAWQRLSLTVLSRRWWSILTAALMVFLNSRFNMAGEWFVGGVEAKGFAFAAILFGLDSMLRNRWNRAWLFWGVASLFHVLVGGWAVLAGMIGWLCLQGDRPKILSMWPGLVGGFLLSLPSLIPSIGLSFGVDAAVVAESNRIYVFERLSHHLDPARFPINYVFRFTVILIIWLLLCRVKSGRPVDRRLQAFVNGSLAIAVSGTLIAIFTVHNTTLAATLLRFYWFRLADIAVPIGVSLMGASHILVAANSRPRIGKILLIVTIGFAGFHLLNLLPVRLVPTKPRTIRMGFGWWEACQWIATPGNVPSDARFLTPRMCQTFKWYARHSEVATRKDIPQDPNSIVNWWQRLEEIHGTDSGDPQDRWHTSLTELDVGKLKRLCRKYGADYILTVTQPRINLEVVYENGGFVVYRVEDDQPPKADPPQKGPQ